MYFKTDSNIQGKRVVSGATRLNFDSMDSFLCNVRPPTDPIETNDDRRIELYRLNKQLPLLKVLLKVYLTHSSDTFISNSR